MHLITDQAVAAIMAKVVTLKPPPVEPGAAPMNIRMIVNIFEKLFTVGRGAAENPAVRAETEANKEVKKRCDKV